MRTTLTKILTLADVEFDVEMPIEYEVISHKADVHEHFGFKCHGPKEYTFEWTFTDEPKAIINEGYSIYLIGQAMGEFERLKDKSIYNIFSREEIIEQLNNII